MSADAVGRYSPHLTIGMIVRRLNHRGDGDDGGERGEIVRSGRVSLRCWIVPRIEHEQRRRLLAESPIARLATVTEEGRPHVVPCCFALCPSAAEPAGGAESGDVIYSVVDAKPKSTVALKRLDNVRATAAASLVVDHYDEDWSELWWVRADGQAMVIESGEEHRLAIAQLVEKYPQYRQNTPDGPVLRIAIDGWSDWTAAPRPTDR